MKYERGRTSGNRQEDPPGTCGYGKAAEDYDISCHTARSYAALYRKFQGIEPKRADRVFRDPAKHVPQDLKSAKAFAENVALFQRCHALYPSHGYRWLKAKISLDTGKDLSDPYVHKRCRAAGTQSKSARIKRRSYRGLAIPIGFPQPPVS